MELPERLKIRNARYQQKNVCKTDVRAGEKYGKSLYFI